MLQVFGGEAQRPLQSVQPVSGLLSIFSPFNMTAHEWSLLHFEILELLFICIHSLEGVWNIMFSVCNMEKFIDIFVTKIVSEER